MITSLEGNKKKLLEGCKTVGFKMKRSSRRWKKKRQMRWKWQRKKLRKEKHKRKAKRARAK